MCANINISVCMTFTHMHCFSLVVVRSCAKKHIETHHYFDFLVGHFPKSMLIIGPCKCFGLTQKSHMQGFTSNPNFKKQVPSKLTNTTWKSLVIGMESTRFGFPRWWCLMMQGHDFLNLTDFGPSDLFGCMLARDAMALWICQFI